MESTIPLGYYRDLITQIETDYENLTKAFEKLKKNTNDKKIFSEICQSYFYLLQDIKYIEKYKENISGLEFSISVRFLKDLKDIRILLRDVNKSLIIANFY
jgi:hypothetical protein